MPLRSHEAGWLLHIDLFIHQRMQICILYIKVVDLCLANSVWMDLLLESEADRSEEKREVGEEE